MICHLIESSCGDRNVILQFVDLQGMLATFNCTILLRVNNASSYYEKFYPLKSHYLATRAPKQWLYNYIIIKTWKYGHLINKTPHQKIKELYYNCNLMQLEHLYGVMYTSYILI